MPPRPPTLFDLSPLRRPIWWAALGLLLVNDHLLKGTGRVPGWLTGKLSDFAFLIVAPVLLAALLPRGLPRRRTLAVLAVSVVYAAADLSPAVSDAIVALAGRLGMQWRLWPDVTDLVALAVLPVACWTLGSTATSTTSETRDERPAPPRRRRLLEPAGVFVGALACLATSAPPSYRGAVFLVNQTAQPQPITLTWLLQRVDCSAELGQLAAALDPNDLDDARAVTVGSGVIAPLNAPPRAGQSSVGVCPDTGEDWGSRYYSQCTAVLVQLASGFAALAVFDGTSADRESDCRGKFSPGEDPGHNALAVREQGGRLVFSVGKNLRVVEVSPAAIAARTPDAGGCRALLAEYEQKISASGSCTIDADCQAIAALRVPGRGCHVYANRNAPAAVADVTSRWASSCVVDSTKPQECPAARPAVCRTGLCQAGDTTGDAGVPDAGVD